MNRIKTLILNRLSIFLIFTIFLCIPAYSYAADFDLVLQWDANTDPDLADNPRYKIYYKTGSSGGNDKNAYIGLPDTEPDVADEGASPIEVAAYGFGTDHDDENADPNIVEFTLHNLDDTKGYYFAVTALDIHGNESDLSNKVATLQITFPEEDGFYVNADNDDSYTVEGMAAADANVEIKINGASFPTPETVQAEADGTWSIDVDFTGIPEGEVSLTAESGGATSEAVTGTYDKTLPTVAMSYSDVAPYRDADTITVTATFTDASEIVGTPQIEINYAGEGSDVTPTNMTEVNNKEWTYSMDVPSGNDGVATITISGISDAAGNPVGEHSGDTFMVDNTAPTVVISYSEPGFYRVGNTITVTATFTDDSDIAGTPQIETDYAGEGSDVIATDMTQVNNKEWTYSMVVPSGNDGTATITVTGLDAAGNAIGAHTDNSFEVDNAPPGKVTGLSSSTHAKETWSGNNTVTVEWTAAEDDPGGSGLGGYSVLWDTNPATEPDTEKNIGIVINTTSDPLSAGDSHWFHIRAVDKAGNWGETEHLGPFYILTAGDVDASLAIDLKDAILSLQLLAKIDISSTIYKEADVNGNGEIGLAEVIYILQEVAGLR